MSVCAGDCESSDLWIRAWKDVDKRVARRGEPELIGRTRREEAECWMICPKTREMRLIVDACEPRSDSSVSGESITSARGPLGTMLCKFSASHVRAWGWMTHRKISCPKLMIGYLAVASHPYNQGHSHSDPPRAQVRTRYPL